MTILEDRPTAEIVDDVVETAEHDESIDAEPTLHDDTDEATVNPFVTSVSSFLATAAAGWLAGGLFSGFTPRLVGVLGALIGAGSVALSYRTRRPSAVQYLGTVASVVVGALLVLPDAGSGSANLPGLIAEALRAGGIGTPPVPFLPGWRFILVVFMSLLAGGGAAASAALNKPKLGIFLPMPIIFGASLLQPTSTPAALTAVAVALVPLAITVSHGAQLAKDGSTSSRFEARRLGRSAGVVAVMMVLLVVLSSLGLLFPEKTEDQVIPPQRPEAPPPQPDRVIFKVKADRLVPWRLGVLDGYDGRGWLLPPFDPKRLITVPPTGEVPPAALTPAPQPGRPTIEATFTVADIQGAVTPGIAGNATVKHQGFGIQFDPRTQTLRMPSGRVPSGTTYTVTAPAPASGAELIASPAPSPAVAEYLRVPTPPEEVVTLLGAAPTTNRYDRLQYVRNAFFQTVVAAGGGKPVDVPPERVAAMLAGNEASPYEITAAEVLLARWAGVPARIGYGFFGGDKTDPSTNEVEIRPKHGATWLEAWFEGHGWVPLIGVPAKAKASKSNDTQDNPDVRPSEDVALAAYVPVRTVSVRLFFELVRYWVARALPLAVGGLLAFWLYPGVLKLLRRALRRRWAARNGPLAAVIASYAEMRDIANDLNIGNPFDSPIEFVELVEYDEEHAELAWLVTRALWGDLHRGVLPKDAEVAAEMAQSVAKRLNRAQPAVTRTIAFGSRVSLRAPYVDEIPNLWPRRAKRSKSSRRSLRSLHPKNLFRFVRRARPAGSAAAAAILVLALLVASCGGGGRSLVANPVLPERTVPEHLGDLQFQREPSLETGFEKAGKNALVNAGQIFSIRKGDEVLGSIQLAAFKPGLIKSNKDLDEIRQGVLGGLGSGTFKPTRVGADVLLEQRQVKTNYYLWFAPDSAYFQFMVAGREMSNAPEVFASLLAFQRGEAPTLRSPNATPLGQIDARRGGVD